MGIFHGSIARCVLRTDDQNQSHLNWLMRDASQSAITYCLPFGDIKVCDHSMRN